VFIIYWESIKKQRILQHSNVLCEAISSIQQFETLDKLFLFVDWLVRIATTMGYYLPSPDRLPVLYLVTGVTLRVTACYDKAYSQHVLCNYLKLSVIYTLLFMTLNTLSMTWFVHILIQPTELSKLYTYVIVTFFLICYEIVIKAGLIIRYWRTFQCMHRNFHSGCLLNDNFNLFKYLPNNLTS